MKTALLLITFLSFNFFTLKSQEKEAERVIKGMDISASSNSRYIAVKPPRNGKVVGSAFLDQKWSTASLSLYNGSTYEGITIRYNLYFDYFEVKKTTQEIIYVDGMYVESFISKNLLHEQKIFQRILKKESGLERSTYGQILFTNQESLILYELTEIDLQRADYNPSLNTGSRDDKITHKNAFWMVYNGVYFKVGNNKKKISGRFGSHQDEILQKIKRAKWSIKNETDLIALITFIDSIL